MRSIRELADRLDPFRVRVAGAVRRMAITLTSGASAIWQVTGFLLLDGTVEVKSFETFTGIGVFARPPTSTKPEAIVAGVNDATSAVIVAVRDEQTRAASAGDLAADESALYNSQARVHVKADGTIEARTIAGTAKQLATKDDLQAVVDYLRKQFDPNTGHTHAVVGAATTTILESAMAGAGAGTAPDPTGTQKLKGE